MIKKKIAAFAAATIAACSVCATAFATTYNVPKYSFGPNTLYQDGGHRTTQSVKKEDDLSAWFNVEQGLSSGEAYVTFRVHKSSGAVATRTLDTWTNGERYIDYYSGDGKKDYYYYLEYYMEPQAVNSVYVGGIWAP